MVSSAASSSGSSCGLRNASGKTASIRVWVALPPAPCDIDAVQDLLLRVGQRQLAAGRRVPFQLIEPLMLVVLVQRLVHPRTLVRAHLVRAHLPRGHARVTCASWTRLRFIRPKL